MNAVSVRFSSRLKPLSMCPCCCWRALAPPAAEALLPSLLLVLPLLRHRLMLALCDAPSVCGAAACCVPATGVLLL
jgi:hypothetical protein